MHFMSQVDGEIGSAGSKPDERACGPIWSVRTIFCMSMATAAT